MDYKLGKRLREKRGSYSLREFASMLNISHTYLDSLEKGVNPKTGKKPRISLELVEKLAEALNVAPDYLLGKNDDPTNYDDGDSAAGAYGSQLDYFGGDRQAYAAFKKAEMEDAMNERPPEAALKANQLQITVADDSIFHGKPEKLQLHVDNLDALEPALAEKLLQKIANSAELFPRSTKKPPDMRITIIDEQILEEPPAPPKKENERKFRVRKDLSVATEPGQAVALLQQLGRSNRMGADELQNRLGTLSPDDYTFMVKIFNEILAEKLDSK